MQEIGPAGLKRILRQRADMLKEGQADWAMGEAFAIGTLLKENRQKSDDSVSWTCIDAQPSTYVQANTTSGQSDTDTQRRATSGQSDTDTQQPFPAGLCRTVALCLAAITRWR